MDISAFYGCSKLKYVLLPNKDIVPDYTNLDNHGSTSNIYYALTNASAKKYNEDDWSREAIVEMFPKEGESFYVKISF